jgi:hypothetical protein
MKAAQIIVVFLTYACVDSEGEFSLTVLPNPVSGAFL